jgi:hypothetical protein
MDGRERWYRELLQAVAAHLENLASKSPELGPHLRPVARRIRQRLFEGPPYEGPPYDGPPYDGPPRGPAEYMEKKRRDKRR